MAYRITYQIQPKRQGIFLHYFRLPVLTLLCFCLFLFLTEILTSDEVIALGGIFTLPGRSIAVSALNEMAGKLYDGESPIIAIVNFWEVLRT